MIFAKGAMMELEFKAGDIVRLKSGGPDMTIEDIGKYGMGAGFTSAHHVTLCSQQ